MGHCPSCPESPAAMATPTWGWEGCQLPEQKGSPTQQVQKKSASCQNGAGATWNVMELSLWGWRGAQGRDTEVHVNVRECLPCPGVSTAALPCLHQRKNIQGNPGSEAVKVAALRIPHPCQLLLEAAVSCPQLPSCRAPSPNKIITLTAPQGLHHPFSFEAEDKFSQNPEAARATGARGWEDPSVSLPPSTARLPQNICKALRGHCWEWATPHPHGMACTQPQLPAERSGMDNVLNTTPAPLHTPCPMERGSSAPLLSRKLLVTTPEFACSAITTLSVLQC